MDREVRRGKAGGGTERGVEGQGASPPVDPGVVAGEPWEPKHQLEVGELNDLQGNVLRVGAVDADAGRVEVGDRSGAAADELHKDGVGVRVGLQRAKANKCSCHVPTFYE